MFTVLQTKKGFAVDQSSIVVAFDSNTAEGSGILVLVTTTTANNVNSVTDSQGNTYTLLQQIDVVNSVWLSDSTSAGSCSITVAYDYEIANQVSVLAREYGDATTFDIYATDSYAGPSAAVTTSVSSSLADSLVIGVASTDSLFVSVTAGTGFSNLDYVSNPFGSYMAIEDKVVSSTGTQTADFTIAPAFEEDPPINGIISVFVLNSGGSAAPDTKGVTGAIMMRTGMGVS